MPVHDLQLILIGASLALSVAVGLQAWREARWSPAIRGLIVALAACGAAYSLLPGPLAGEWPRAARVLVRTLAAPGVLLLWLLLRAVFADALAPQRWHWAAGVLLAGSAALGWVDRGVPGAWTALGTGLLALAALAFTLHGLWHLLAGRRDDLEPARRRLRVWLAASGGLVVVGALAGAAWQLPSRWPGYPALLLGLQVVAKLGWLWLAAWPSSPVVRWLSPLPMLPPASGTADEGADLASASDPRRAAEAVLATVRSRQLHHRTGLTIGELARELRLPEQRLRQAINQDLGFRNFNAFLNRLRLEDVAARLADPAQAGVAVTTLALDAGYASLGPFNRAFREAYGMTPSEFRRRKGAAPLADS